MHRWEHKCRKWLWWRWRKTPQNKPHTLKKEKRGNSLDCKKRPIGDDLRLLVQIQVQHFHSHFRCFLLVVCRSIGSSLTTKEEWREKWSWFPIPLQPRTHSCQFQRLTEETEKKKKKKKKSTTREINSKKETLKSCRMWQEGHIGLTRIENVQIKRKILIRKKSEPNFESLDLWRELNTVTFFL